ncbi:MAG: hypothetical protein GAK30_03443 [Paracidovorax wautersii]|uniref:Lipocalin-like domain-containing protein n=1 Tax=Paracidovorax wautersii TaxID=1177982 RepID=A0A7V8JNT5_9BURK|nr:MAG: hypothetical protein GAK30_03443 [Paracidovorax wautersii]
MTPQLLLSPWRRLALGLLAWLLTACAPLPPAGQPSAQADAAPACPVPTGAESAPLYGTWTVQIAGQPDGRLQLQRHPDYADSLSGSYTRGQGAPIRVAGDVDQGLFTLEESADGQRTTGRWSGQWSPADCRNEIRGTWIDARQESAVLFPGDNKREPQPHAFVMRRAIGWQ